MRKAGLIVGRVLEALEECAVPGVTTGALDRLAKEMLVEAKAASSFLGYGAALGIPPFPAVTCVSVNEQVVHGIPGDRVLVEGDLVSVDFGASIDGWHGDAARTFGVGTLEPELATLNAVTREAMWAGIGAGHVGGRIGDISHAVQSYIESQDRHYGIVAEYTGHGIGSAMHQPPEVPNRGRAGRGVRIVDGLCLAVEPMVTLGSPQTATLSDEWTVVSADFSWAAHWEHSVAYTRAGLWVLTAIDGGEAELTARGLPFAPLSD